MRRGSKVMIMGVGGMRHQGNPNIIQGDPKKCPIAIFCKDCLSSLISMLRAGFMKKKSDNF